jgi:hypothetical protein
MFVYNTAGYHRTSGLLHNDLQRLDLKPSDIQVNHKRSILATPLDVPFRTGHVFFQNIDVRDFLGLNAGTATMLLMLAHH